MREYLVLPAAKLHQSHHLSYEQLALVETLGIGAHAVDRAQISPGEDVLVIGAGPIGLSVMQFARLAGARVIALDMSAARLDFAQSQGTVDHTLVVGNDVLAHVQELTQGDLPTVVFDATGNPASMNSAFQYVAHGGRLIYVGLVQSDLTFNDPFFHRREISLLASRNATPANLQQIISQIERGAINTDPWISHRAQVTTFVEQFPRWLQPDAGLVKGMLAMSAS
jgi:2-desacetyl-2-hydroxyethyl bacteriochlorophyllide A dehydrogenase